MGNVRHEISLKHSFVLFLPSVSDASNLSVICCVTCALAAGITREGECGFALCGRA